MRIERTYSPVAALCMACALNAPAWASLPPHSNSVVYNSSTSVDGNTINSPFNPGANGGPGFNDVTIDNAGNAYVHVNLYAPPPPVPGVLPTDRFHSVNQAILYTGSPVPFLLGGAGYDEFSSTVGLVSVPSANYIFDEGFRIAMNNNGVGAFSLRLGATASNLVQPVTGIYFNKTAMPVKEGDPVTAAGVAPGSVFGSFGPARELRYPDGAPTSAPLTSNIQVNDNNVYLIASSIVENSVSRRAILKVAVDSAGAVISQTLVAKEGGPVGAGPATWTSLFTAPNTSAINNAGNVIFSGTTSAGVDGIYKTNGSGGGFVAIAGGPAPNGGVWAPLAGAPVDLNNGGEYAFRGIIQSNGTWTEVGEAGETFGSTAGFFTPTANITQGGGDLTTIVGSLSNDSDVDVYQIKIGDPTLATQQPFSATTVPNPGAGFAGANFDTVLHLFAFRFSNNGNTRNGVGRCDDAAAGVQQSTLTAASLQTSTHIPGDTYFLAVSTPKARATTRAFAGLSSTDMWASMPGPIAVSGNIAYWVDPRKGQIGRADTSTGAILAPLQVGVAPQQLSGAQAADPNSRLLDQRIAIYEAGANSKLIFREQSSGGVVMKTCNLDGSAIADLLPPTATGNLSSFGISNITVDNVHSKVYYAKNVAGGAALINRCDVDGNNAETIITVVDTGGFNESYIIEALAIDTVGTGKVYWSQTVYDLSAPFYSQGNLIRRADLDGTNIQNLTVTGASGALNFAIDTAGRKLYFASRLNKLAWLDLSLPGPSYAANLLVSTTSPLGVGLDAANSTIYWSNPLERMLRRSSTTAPSVQNWLGIGPDIGEGPADGPASTNGFNTFVRSGTAGSTPLPYQIKLTGATFGVQGAAICKNGTSIVAQVGQPLPGTANVATVVGSPSGPVRISDAGNVAWIGATTQNGQLFVNSDPLLLTTDVQASASAGAMDMSSNGQYLIVTGGYQTTERCVKVAFFTDSGAGACCDTSGGCQLVLQASCMGTFLGAGSCSPNPCQQPGACCNNTTFACSFTLQAACTAGSTWNGAGVCSPSPCAPTTGACCCGSHCSVTTAAACTGTSTRFAGTGTSCTPFSFTAPCCRGDYNKTNPPATVQDIFDFLTGYFSSSPCADSNDNGAVTVQDIFDFLAAYFGGC